MHRGYAAFACNPLTKAATRITSTLGHCLAACGTFSRFNCSKNGRSGGSWIALSKCALAEIKKHLAQSEELPKQADGLEGVMLN
jgi:hypothetical protein